MRLDGFECGMSAPHIRHNAAMRALLVAGVLLLLLGLASLFVPIPYRQRHGINAGPVSVGVTTTERRKLPPAISATLIVTGAALMVVGSRRKA